MNKHYRDALARGAVKAAVEKMADEIAPETYEYAGFRFRVDRRADGLHMIPLPGQHSAAYKERHARNARDQYLDEECGR